MSHAVNVNIIRISERSVQILAGIYEITYNV